MGWYFRKSVNFGPFRLNASNSGLGMSFGVPGMRVGSGPRGNYVTMGRGGIYYRQSLSSRPTSRTGGRSFAPVPGPLPQALPAAAPGLGEFHSLSAGNTSAMVDASSADLLAELNRVQARTPRLWIAAVVIVCAVVASMSPAQVPAVRIAAAVLAIVVAYAAWLSDHLHGRVTLNYDLDPFAAQEFDRLRLAIGSLGTCQVVRHTAAAAAVIDTKRNSGASQAVRADNVHTVEGKPRRIECNLDVPILPAGARTLYFFPDRLLVYDGTRVGAVSYRELRGVAGTTRFIESGSAPSDSQVVGQTWQYVNKSGGPDRRFNNNRQLPIMLYGILDLSSATGLKDQFMCSRPDVASSAAQAINDAARHAHP